MYIEFNKFLLVFINFLSAWEFLNMVVFVELFNLIKKISENGLAVLNKHFQ